MGHQVTFVQSPLRPCAMAAMKQTMCIAQGAAAQAGAQAGAMAMWW